MENQNTTDSQPQLGSDAALGVGVLLMLTFSKGVMEAVIEAQYQDRYLLIGKFGRKIMTMKELKNRHYMVLPQRPPPARLSWWTKSVYAKQPEP